MTLAFDKSRADDRKAWLMKYDREEILTYEEREVSYTDFIHKDLKHFSNDDTQRSIPHIMDGLKPSQRKILYGAFLRGLDKTEVKVAQLAGFVSDKAAYHHGEASLNGAIIGMAQNYVGSNNINILKPNGQFGTRLQGGKDAASPRYTFTELSDLSTDIFRTVDNCVLNQQTEDGMDIEPEYYAPIIPMILVNGATGIGTGFSTKIPNFNPKDIITNLISLLDGGKLKNMKPYWNNFNGKVTKIDSNNFNVEGVYTIKKDKLIITELPVGEWTQNYKDFLEKTLDVEASKKSKTFINYKDNNTDEKVYFELEFAKGTLEKLKDITKQFHLIKKVSLTNMHFIFNYW
jgi:DNA topoisomerase-2